METLIQRWKALTAEMDVPSLDAATETVLLEKIWRVEDELGPEVVAQLIDAS